VVNKWGVKHIHFEDDGLLVDKNRFEGILDELMVRGIKFTWDTPNGVRADGLTPNFLKKMKKSGCIGLAIGVESGDQNILDNIINKSLKLSDVIQVAHACKQLNINFSPYRSLSTFYIIGLPGEKKENIKKTLDFALDLKRKYGGNMCISLATPFFGTRLYDICVKKGYLAKELTPQAFAEAEP
jgi:magnesium-protoporphyrin IX monomethyl ester (oxidative) cyclase